MGDDRSGQRGAALVEHAEDQSKDEDRRYGLRLGHVRAAEYRGGQQNGDPTLAKRPQERGLNQPAKEQFFGDRRDDASADPDDRSQPSGLIGRLQCLDGDMLAGREIGIQGDKYPERHLVHDVTKRERAQRTDYTIGNLGSRTLMQPNHAA